MKVLIVVLMAILLPLQAAWSAAAVFCCQHENRTAWHWGHHQHSMDAACQQAAPHDQNPDSQKNYAVKDNNTFKKMLMLKKMQLFKKM